VFFVKLYDIHATVPIEALLYNFVEPSHWYFPAMAPGVPLRLVTPLAAKPRVVVSAERKANQ
jgi:hypothetical protein